MKRSRDAVQKVYGFDFPDDLFAFDDFVRSNAKLVSDIGVGADGPLAVLSGDAGRVGWNPRFYNDPPEFFTVLVGNTDGLHWGYWFDAPGELPAVVVSYFHSDSYQFSIDGVTLFEALRGQLENLHIGNDENKKDDPDEADGYDRRLETIAKVRRKMSQYAFAGRKEVGQAYFDRYSSVRANPGRRKTIAKTRNGMGIVAAKSAYRPLPGQDLFVEKNNYEPKRSEVTRFVARANEYAQSGQPGTALKLGHDLWPYREYAAEAAQRLSLAYDRLERPVLRTYLDRAVAFRRSCDAKRK